MKYQVTPQQITNELYNIFSNDGRAAQYLTGSHPQYLGVLGWCGPMSPMNRAAFLSAFGAEQVAKAEQEARARVAEYRAAVDRSTYHRNEMAADAFEASGEVPAVGSFVWGRWSCLKGEGGPLGELEDLERMAKDGEDIGRRLCEVVAVVDASPADFLDREACNRIARRFKIYGGSRYDEQDPQSLKGFPLTWELVFCVRCAGRWFLIDGQGYDYTRYFLMPDSYGRMFAPELDAIRADREAKEVAERAAEQAAKEERRRQYLERCAPWWGRLVDVEPLQDAEKSAPRGSDAMKAARRALQAAQRKNILTMCRAAFPGVKFACRRSNGWGASFVISWTDGPTEERFKEVAAVDLLFSTGEYYSNMDDSYSCDEKEFQDFAAKYMGYTYGSYECRRDESAEFKAEICAKIRAAVPGIPEDGKIRENAQQSAVCALFADVPGVRLSVIVDHLDYNGITAAAWYIAKHTDRPATDGSPTGTDGQGVKGQGVEGETSEGTPSEGSTGAAYGIGEKSPISEKPAAGLQLVDIAGGGVAVTGDSRATYKARKEIKSHGATWNKAAKQWEAHDPAAVASLREWFGVTVQDATPEASAPVDELPAPPALVSYDPAEPVERAELHTSDEVEPTAPTDGSHPTTEETPTEAPAPTDGATGAAYGTCEKSPVPESLAALYEQAKTKRPDAVALFRCCNWFTAYGEDADKVAQAVGIIVTVNREGYRLASFPSVALDTYLPRMIRQGLTVCICEVPPTPPTRPTDPTGTDGSHPATEGTPTEDPAPTDGGTGAAYGSSEKSPISEEVAVSVPEVKEYKLMYLFGAWVCHSRVYAETDAEAIHDATDNYISSTLPRWAYRVALWEGSRLVHVFKEDGPDDIGRRDMEQEESENAPAYIVHDTTEGPFRFDDCATGSILAAVDRVAENEHMANPHPLQLFADGVKVWDREEHPTEYLAHIVRQRLAL